MSTVETHAKVLCSICVDPHSWVAMVGFGVIFTPEMAHDATEYIKLYAAIVGALIITASGLHKWIQFRKEKKKK